MRRPILTSPSCLKSVKSDGKGKATPSGARKLLVGLGFLAIRSQRADGGKGIFFKEFSDPTAIRPSAILAAESLTRLIALLQYDNYLL